MAGVQQAPIIPNVNIGGRIITDLTNLIMLSGVCNGAGLGNSGLRVPFAAGARVVTSGKTFRVVAVSMSVQTAGGTLLGYCDNDPGMGTNTALANAVYFATSGLGALNSAVNTYTERPIQYDVPAGKYLFCSNGAGALVANICVYGYEF